MTQGYISLISMAIIGSPVIYYGYQIKNNLISYAPFIIINSILFFLIYIWTFFLLCFEDPELFEIFNFDGLGVYKVGPSILTHWLNFFSVSGLISYWVLRINKFDVPALINYFSKEKDKNGNEELEKMEELTEEKTQNDND